MKDVYEDANYMSNFKVKCTVIASVLDSQEVLTRQLKHLQGLIPVDWEVIIMDDGSDEPLIAPPVNYRLQIIQTHNKTPWMQMAARDLAAFRYAKGEYLLFFDIDHILTKEAIDSVQWYAYEKMLFPRTYGMLDEDGKIKTDDKTLLEYGADPLNLGWEGMHENTFAMPAHIFRDVLGGYSKYFYGKYPGDDADLRDRYNTMGKSVTLGGNIHVFPRPSEDVKGLFHRLSRGQS